MAEIENKQLAHIEDAQNSDGLTLGEVDSLIRSMSFIMPGSLREDVIKKLETPKDIKGTKDVKLDSLLDLARLIFYR